MYHFISGYTAKVCTCQHSSWGHVTASHKSQHLFCHDMWGPRHLHSAACTAAVGHRRFAKQLACAIACCPWQTGRPACNALPSLP